MYKYLPYLEIAFIASAVLGFILQSMGIELTELLIIGLSGLAVSFFLNAHKPAEEPASPTDEPKGFGHLLGFVILPKIAWISCAIATIGILFNIMQFGNDQGSTMLYIGGFNLLLISVILIAMNFTQGGLINRMQPLLLRATPLMIIVGYLLFN